MTMENPSCIPPGYARARIAASLADLMAARWEGEGKVNLIVLPRKLTPDFNALAAELGKKLRSGDLGRYRSFSLADMALAARTLPSPARAAAAFILEEDMMPLSKRFGPVSLKAVDRYNWDRSDTGAHALHADGGALVCGGYTDPVTEFARNEDAVLHRSVPGGHFFGAPREGLFSLPPGALWRQAGWNLRKEGACVHRAPRARPGGPPRLFLVGMGD